MFIYSAEELKIGRGGGICLNRFIVLQSKQLFVQQRHGNVLLIAGVVSKPVVNLLWIQSIETLLLLSSIFAFCISLISDKCASGQSPNVNKAHPILASE